VSNKRIGKIVAALGAAAVVASVMGAATPALAAPTSATTPNWAGYVAQPSKQILTADVSFTIPKNLTCNSALGHYPAVADMWVGIGGYNPPVGSHLQQAGVSMTCNTATSTPAIMPFWESYIAIKPGAKEPAAGNAQYFVNHEKSLKAGDQVSVEVDAPARSDKPGYWEFWLDVNGSDSPLKAYWKPTRSTQVKNTAEVITEWTGGENYPAAAGLIDLPVTYTGASYTTSAPGDEGNPIAEGTKVILGETHWVTTLLGLRQKTQNVIVPLAPTDSGYDFTYSYTGYL
jgi:hypothetical protein